jgi:two-component system response regulator
MRALLVEDNPGDVRLMREAIAITGIELTLDVAKDGVEAIDRLKGGARDAPPDIILLDLNLPLKSGRQVLAEIKQSERLRRIPVIVFSNSMSSDDVDDTYALHANSYIAKPAGLDDYIATVRSISEYWFDTARLPSH